ncbi:MFS transporter [Sphingomonas carotinifaciens]|uniref:MFS transporter n=1 Tax=Sphingomonas carotinifaciens TaxID=1166323 RepID=A0A6N8LZL3_9SPHN|nr:MFS transporter [Sphingomonas carotinifaciens]MBB4087614.1 MFS family permease [Sphingomonas carotinifaciens]MWC45699.1 MFS transporter [Sphingomonas carotinifaciens]
MNVTNETVCEPAAPAPGDEADTTPPRAWFALGVLLAVTLLTLLGRQMLSLLAPAIAADLRLSDRNLGVTLGIGFAGASLLCAYPIAWLADRYDRRIMLGACILVWATGALVCGYADGMWQLFGATALIGIAEAGLGPVVLAVIPDLFTGRRRLTANLVFYMAGLLGASVVYIIGGALASGVEGAKIAMPVGSSSTAAWRLAFAIVGCSAPLLIALLACVRMDRRQPVALQRLGSPLLTHLAVQRRPVVLIVGAFLLFMLASSGALIWIPTASTRLFGASPLANGVGVGVGLALGTLAGTGLTSMLLKRTLLAASEPVSVIAVRLAWRAALPALPALFALQFISRAAGGFILFVIFMASSAAVGSLLPTVLQDMVPSAMRARFLAIWTIAAGIVGGIAPALIGAVSSLLGNTPQALLSAITWTALPAWSMMVILFYAAERPVLRLRAAVTSAEAGW